MPTKRVFPTRTLQHLASSAPHPRLRRVAETELKKRDDIAKGGYTSRLSAWVESAKQKSDGAYLVKTFGEEAAEEALTRWYVERGKDATPAGDKAFRQLKRSGGYTVS